MRKRVEDLWRTSGPIRLRRGKEACWVDPVAEGARYRRLLAEGCAR